MKLSIALIDDQDSKELAREIEAMGDLTVHPMAPPSDLDLTEILQTNPDLFLVDYELDTRQPNGDKANYRGMTLAARIREDRADYPIVLLTRSDIVVWSLAQRTVIEDGPFDDVLYKSEHIRGSSAATLRKLHSLAHGYEELRQGRGDSVESLLHLLRTDDVGREKALQTRPPDGQWAVVEAADWIRSVLLRHPGVLYGPMYAATALGISIASFEQPGVQEIISGASYRGPFKEEKLRWWRHNLYRIAYRLIEGRETEMGFREAFRVVVNERFGIELEPSLDAESGSEQADTVCYVLCIPVRYETSLPYRPDMRPPVMDEARVSFHAIQVSNCVDDNHFDPPSRALLQEIRQIPHAD